jgi:hypothetical protein
MRLSTLLISGLLFAMPATLAAQQGDSARRAQMEARRDSLEREIVQKFVVRLTRDLRLDAEQRAQTERILTENGVRRRELMNQAGALRGRMFRATRAESTADTEFTRLLTEHEALRAREHDLWRREQEELARVLSPRQRVQFVTAWAHFQEEMREILSRRMREQAPPRQERPPGTPSGGERHEH